MDLSPVPSNCHMPPEKEFTMPQRALVALLALTAFTLAPAAMTAAADRPNVVWIVSEDNSIHYLNHFFDGGAKTPHIESLAAHGLTFNNAFSNAPVCSVARTTLATACYGPRIGTQFHRRYALAPMPKGLKMFPAYLRDAGYFTTNNSRRITTRSKDRVFGMPHHALLHGETGLEGQPFFHMQSHAQYMKEACTSIAGYSSEEPKRILTSNWKTITPIHHCFVTHMLATSIACSISTRSWEEPSNNYGRMEFWKTHSFSTSVTTAAYSHEAKGISTSQVCTFPWSSAFQKISGTSFPVPTAHA